MEKFDYNAKVVDLLYEANLLWFALGEMISADIGVDSGMCGIFDESYYKHFHTSEGVDDRWYDMVCDKTSNVNVGSTMDGVCAFSATGFGDGGYDLYIKRNDEGKIIAIGVQYLDDDYEWDEEDEFPPRKAD